MWEGNGRKTVAMRRQPTGTHGRGNKHVIPREAATTVDNCGVRIAGHTGMQLDEVRFTHRTIMDQAYTDDVRFHGQWHIDGVL